MNPRMLVGIIIVALLVTAGGIYYWKYYGKQETSPSSQPPVTSGDQALPGSQVHDLPVEPAAAQARKDLAKRLKVDEKSILIVEVKETDWPDACLGLAEEGEICAQVITPGFWVILKTGGIEYFYRTNKTGSVIRLEPEQGKG